MSNFEEAIDDIKNLFLADPEEVSLLVGLMIEASNLIKQTIDEINRERLVVKKHCTKTI